MLGPDNLDPFEQIGIHFVFLVSLRSPWSRVQARDTTQQAFEMDSISPKNGQQMDALKHTGELIQ